MQLPLLLFDAALHHFKTPGKAFRANLALSSGLALNLKPDSFIYWAAACELLHNASLVHDDISDQFSSVGFSANDSVIETLDADFVNYKTDKLSSFLKEINAIE